MFVESQKVRKTLDRELEPEDLFYLPKGDDPTLRRAVFEKAYYEEEKSLWSSVWSVIRYNYRIAGVIKFFNSALQFGFPLLLRQVLLFIQGDGDNGYAFAIALGAAMFTKAITENTYFWLVARSVWSTRVALQTSIYAKSLRLSRDSRESRSLGQIMNHMQLDTTKVEMFLMQGHVLWDAVFQITGYMAVIYSVIGRSAFAGLAFLLFSMPVQIYLMVKIKNETTSLSCSLILE